MIMKEMFICAKTRDQSANEDGLVMTDEFACVIDGATSKGGMLWEGMKPGCFAKTVLEEQMYCTTIRNKTPEKFFTELDDALKRAVKRTHPDAEDHERPRASVVLYNSITKEIWRYGDSLFMVNGTIHPRKKKIDLLTAAVRSFTISCALKEGTAEDGIRENDIGREAILPLLQKQSTFENDPSSEWGYPVLNGRGIEPSMIEVFPVRDGDMVVLASDGYPELRETLEESEERLAELLKTDPLCFREIRTTKCPGEDALSYDDRTYIRMEV